MVEDTGKNRFSMGLIPLIIIPVVFLGLISYFGLIETVQSYSRLLNERIAILGRDTADTINDGLTGDSDLAGYRGFAAAADGLLKAEPAVRLVEITDTNNRAVYEQEQAAAEEDMPFSQTFNQAGFQLDDSGYTQAQNPTAFMLAFPLTNRTGVVGNLQLIIPRAAGFRAVTDASWYAWPACGAAVLLFALLLLLFLRRVSRGSKLVIGIIWCIFLCGLSAYLGYTMYDLTAAQLQAKTKTLNTSLLRSVQNAFAGGVDAGFLRSTLNTFTRYKKLDTDIAFISLVGGDTELLHTADENSGEQLPTIPDSAYEVISTPVSPDLSVNVGIKNSLLAEKLFPDFKDLGIVLVASIIISLCLLNLVWAARKRPAVTGFGVESGRPESSPVPVGPGFARSELIYPLAFLVIFTEALIVWVLPSYIRDAVKGVEPSQYLTAAIFSVYFAGLWVSILPARFIAKRTNLKGLLTAGALAMTAGYLALGFLHEYYYIILSRALAGMGQGMIFAGLFTMYERTAGEDNRSGRSSFSFLAYAGGMAVGIGCGSLLASFAALDVLFLAAGGMAAFVFIYTLLFLGGMAPGGAGTGEEGQGEPVIKKIFLTITDGAFFKSFFFLGMIIRIIITGIVIFMLPLLLQETFSLRQLGQLISMYFACLFLSGLVFSGGILKSAHIRFFLFLGTQLAGLALFALGFMNWPPLARILPFPVNTTVFMLAGLGSLGLAHGLLVVPVSGYVSAGKSAAFWSPSSLDSGFSFAQQIGSLAGPLLAVQLMIFLDYNMLALSWIGVASILGGILFAIGRSAASGPRVKTAGDKFTQL